MPEFPTDTFGPGDEPRPVTVFDLAFTVIAVLASSFSGYTTYLGFSYDLPTLLSVVMAVIIGLGLLVINFKIRDARLSGDDLGPPLLAFSLFLVFSFISNTNAIYTYFLENDIVGETQEEAWRNFDRGTATVLAAIAEHPISIEGAQVKQDLDVARRNLRNQVTDRGNPGLGPQAREHLQEIETILGAPLTRLQPPPPSAPIAEHERYADRLDELILEVFATQNANLRSAQYAVDSLRARIEKLRALYQDLITRKQYSREITDGMKNDFDTLVVQARQLIGFDAELPTINTTADDIGSFQYTWQNFYDGTNLPAIILSILLSIMLDVLTPILSLLLYKPEVEF
jgi:hypothetical protein